MFCCVYMTCPQVTIFKHPQTVEWLLWAHGENAGTQFGAGYERLLLLNMLCLFMVCRVTMPLNAGEIFYPASYLKWIINWMIKCMLIWMYLPGFIYGHVWPRIRAWVFLRACRECSLRTEFGLDPPSVVMAHEEKWVFMLFNQIHHVGY